MDDEIGNVAAAGLFGFLLDEIGPSAVDTDGRCAALGKVRQKGINYLYRFFGVTGIMSFNAHTADKPIHRPARAWRRVAAGRASVRPGSPDG